MVGEHFGFGRRDLFDAPLAELMWLVDCINGGEPEPAPETDE